MRPLAPAVCMTLALLSPALAVWAQQPGSTPQKPAAQPEPNTGDPVTDDFARGFNGDAAAMDRAIKAAERILAETPDHAPMLAWLGAAQGMRAGEAFQRGESADGLRLWTASISNLNRGVEIEPDNTTVRMLRGKSMLESSVHDPNPMTSKAALETSITDLEHIIKVHGDQIDARVAAGSRARIYGWLAQGLGRAGRKEESERYLKLARELGFKEPAKRPDVREPASANLSLDSALVALPGEPASLVAENLRAGLRDPSRFDKAIALLDERIAAKPEDGALLAWRGFARTLSSAQFFAKGKWPEGIKVWQTGADEIDKAANADPASVHPRVLRALTSLETARHEQDADKARQAAERAAGDLDRAWRTLCGAPGDAPEPGAAAAQPPVAVRCELLLLSAEALGRAGRRAPAEQAVARALGLEPDAKTKARAQKLLERIAPPPAKP